MDIVITVYLIEYYIFSFVYFLVVTVRGYHWISTPRINIYLLNVNINQCFLLFHINSTYSKNLALIGCLLQKLLLAYHVYRSHWISVHITSLFTLYWSL